MAAKTPKTTKKVTIAYLAQAMGIKSDHAVYALIANKTVTLRSETHFSKLVDRENWNYEHTNLPAGTEVELLSIANQGFNGIKGYVKIGDWTSHVDINQLVTTMTV